MRLYHGTSAKLLPTIMQHGIKPRGRRKSNWDISSHPNSVYLTTAYALYFASRAAKDKDDLVLLEVVPTALPALWAPDEDALEQALRNKDGVPGTVAGRTRYYRGLLAANRGPFTAPVVQDSLRALGTCVHMGTVWPNAITRYAVIDRQQVDKSLMWQAIDPTITITNYQLCGSRYRNMVRWVFGDTAEFETSPYGIDFNPPASRAGITVEVVGDALQVARAG